MSRVSGQTLADADPETALGTMVELHRRIHPVREVRLGSLVELHRRIHPVREVRLGSLKSCLDDRIAAAGQLDRDRRRRAA